MPAIWHLVLQEVLLRMLLRVLLQTMLPVLLLLWLHCGSGDQAAVGSHWRNGAGSGQLVKARHLLLWLHCRWPLFVALMARGWIEGLLMEAHWSRCMLCWARRQERLLGWACAMGVAAAVARAQRMAADLG